MTQDKMNVIADEIDHAHREDSRGMAPVGAAADIIRYLQQGRFVEAKNTASLDRDKFACDRKTKEVLEKHFGCMLHGVVECDQCLKWFGRTGA